MAALGIAVDGDGEIKIVPALASLKESADAATATAKTALNVAGQNETAACDAKIAELLAQTDIPVIATKEESYAVTSKINSMTVKTQPQDSDKIPVIKKLITEHVDLKALLARA